MSEEQLTGLQSVESWKKVTEVIGQVYYITIIDYCHYNSNQHLYLHHRYRNLFFMCFSILVTLLQCCRIC